MLPQPNMQLEVFGLVNVILSNYREGIDNDTVVWFNPVRKGSVIGYQPTHFSLSLSLSVIRLQYPSTSNQAMGVISDSSTQSTVT